MYFSNFSENSTVILEITENLCIHITIQFELLIVTNAFEF
jgi:hypothetical protein